MRWVRERILKLFLRRLSMSCSCTYQRFNALRLSQTVHKVEHNKNNQTQVTRNQLLPTSFRNAADLYKHHLSLPINHYYKPSPPWATVDRGKTTSQATLAHHRLLVTHSTTNGLAINTIESDTCATRSARRRSEAGRTESLLRWLVQAKTLDEQGRRRDLGRINGAA
jgi:hypothetical protein